MAPTIQRRWEIVFLNKHEYGPKWNFSKISKYLDIDRNIVKKWIDRYEETGDVQDLEGGGRKKSTLAREDSMIVQLFENDDEMTLGKAKAILKKKEYIKLSIPTISRRLHAAGFSIKLPLSKPLLSNDHIRKRLE